MGGSLSAQDQGALADEGELLQPITHPLLSRFEVTGHGILGASKSRGINQTVVVDLMDPQAICGKSPDRVATTQDAHTLYDLLGIGGAQGNYPAEVKAYLASARQQSKKGGVVRYHCYGSGKHVIHALGVDLRDLEQSVRDLTETYCAILKEFVLSLQGCCAGSRLGELPPPKLRLVPIPQGVRTSDTVKENIGNILWSAVSVALSRLPEALGKRLRSATVDLCVGEEGLDVECFEKALASKQQIAAAGVMLADPLVGKLQPKAQSGEKGYDWVFSDNTPKARLQRLLASSVTMQVLAQGQYTFPDGATVRLRRLDELLADTYVIRAREIEEITVGSGELAETEIERETAGSEGGLSSSHQGTSSRELAVPEGISKASVDTSVDSRRSAPSLQLQVEDGTAMAIAVGRTRQGKAVVALNAASAYHLGGGVFTGGRHALEEAWCMITPLAKSLQQAQLLEEERERDAALLAGHAEEAASHQHVPEDGVVVSPNVEVFRKGTFGGYEFLSKPVMLAGILSVAMYNMNPKVRDSPMDAPRDPAQYREGVRDKFRATLKGVVALGAEVLVVPDVGCGVFANDPDVVGSIFGRALLEDLPPCALREVVITSKNERFVEAVRREYEGEAPAESRTVGRPGGPDKQDSKGRRQKKVCAITKPPDFYDRMLGGRGDKGGIDASKSDDEKSSRCRTS